MMPDRFETIIGNSHQETEKSKFAGRIFYGLLAVGVAVSLYVAFFADSKTDQQARNDIAEAAQTNYETCVAQNNVRKDSNKELRKPLREFAARQEAATNALVKLLNSIPQNPNQTAQQKKNFDVFVSAYNQQAEAAEVLKDVPLVPLLNCKKLLQPSA